MHLRRCSKTRGAKTHEYWQLVESVRTARGSRKRVVAYLGDLGEAERLGVQAAAEWGDGAAERHQGGLFKETQPSWAQVDIKGVRVEGCRAFGGPWLGWQLVERLGLRELFEELMPQGRAEIEWSVMALVLVVARLCDPSSELHIAEHFYERSALPDLLGLAVDKVNDDRLYRALDHLLPHKRALETHLKERLGELFELDYDLLLYDITSTYFEGACARNEQAQRGYSRDHRGDCKQVCIALVVSREGLPLGYEVFAGNRADVTTVQAIVEEMEARYGRANRVWAMDRGMVSAENLEFLQAGGRRYIVGTPRHELKRFEQELLDSGWAEIRAGLEVKLCPGPAGQEVFILCRSAARREKEAAIHARFEARLLDGLEHIAAGCRQRRQQVALIERRIGRLLERNSRVSGCYRVAVQPRADGGAVVTWTKVAAWQEWAQLSAGCYLLRSNVTQWSAEELWQAYIQLTQAESAFRLCKQELGLRPIWHQRQDRVQAHILVCFLAYVLWKTLGQMCRVAGLGDQPRRVFEELSQLRLVDVVLPTRNGVELRKSCVTRPDKAQAILLQRLRLTLPHSLENNKMWSRQMTQNPATASTHTA
jgi:transposase